MPTEILMPALSPTMEEGKLAKWLVQEGTRIKPGDIIAEIETDKATMEVEAIDDGVMGQLLVAAGTEKVRINTPIAVLLVDGEKAGAPRPTAAPGPVAPTRPATASATASAPAAKPAAAAPSTPPSRPVATAGATQGANGQGAAPRVLASPLARRLAAERGMDLASLTGSGPHGRVVQRDIEAGMQSGRGGQATAGAGGRTLVNTAPAPQASAGQLAIQAMPDDKILALYEKDGYEVVPHDGMRRVIAQRLTQSKQTIPHFYMTVDCMLDGLLAARERINAAAPKEGPRAYKLSVNDFVIKALALALQQVPAANATWTDAGMLRHRHSDVGVAVAVEGGLFTPIIKHAELKTLGEISNEMKDMAARARNRRLPHTNTRVAPPRSPISACTASRASTPSSIRRTPPFLRSAPARNGLWSPVTRCGSRPS